ncbi:MAG: metal-dependent transcriptional regulator, partial [Clostridia bacterium]|nr:metal-dependent transcriptional regulator [Clostridia bacterium]
ISRAVGLLKNAGYLLMDPTGYLTLTDSGRAIAEKIYERHNTLSKFFITLGVDEKTAQEDACKVEHYISDTTFDRIKAFTQQGQI